MKMNKKERQMMIDNLKDNILKDALNCGGGLTTDQLKKMTPDADLMVNSLGSLQQDGYLTVSTTEDDKIVYSLTPSGKTEAIIISAPF